MSNDHIEAHRKTGFVGLYDAYAAHFQQSFNGRWRTCCEDTVYVLKQNLIVTYKVPADGVC